MLEMQKPGNLVEGRFRLQMRLSFGLLENRRIYPKIAFAEGVEYRVPNRLRILGGVKDLIELQSSPSQFTA